MDKSDIGIGDPDSQAVLAEVKSSLSGLDLPSVQAAMALVAATTTGVELPAGSDVPTEFHWKAVGTKRRTIPEDETIVELRRLVPKVIAEAVRKVRMDGTPVYIIACMIGVSESTLRVWQQPDEANKGKGTLRSYDLAAVVRLFRMADMSMDRAFESILEKPDQVPALQEELAEVKAELRRYQLIVDALLEHPKRGAEK